MAVRLAQVPSLRGWQPSVKSGGRPSTRAACLGFLGHCLRPGPAERQGVTRAGHVGNGAVRGILHGSWRRPKAAQGSLCKYRIYPIRPRSARRAASARTTGRAVCPIVKSPQGHLFLDLHNHHNELSDRGSEPIRQHAEPGITFARLGLRGLGGTDFPFGKSHFFSPPGLTA